MARASSRNMSLTMRPLRDAWDGSGRLRRDTGFGGAYTQSKAQEAKDLLETGARRSKGEPIDAVKIPLAARQRSSSAAVSQGLAPANTSPSTTNPGTVSPSQPQRQAPGVRNFDLFGGVYTWSAAQQTKDEEELRAGRTKNGLSDAVVRQPAAGAVGGWDPSVTGEDYGTVAAEFASVGAGNPALAATAAKSAGGLVRAGGAGNFAVDAARGLERAEGTLGRIEAKPGITYTPPAAYADKMSVEQAQRNRDAIWRSEKLYDQRMNEMQAKVLADPEGMSKTYEVDKWGFKVPHEDLNAGLERQQQSWAKEYQAEIEPVNLPRTAVPAGRSAEPWWLEGAPRPDRKKGSGVLVW